MLYPFLSTWRTFFLSFFPFLPLYCVKFVLHNLRHSCLKTRTTSNHWVWVFTIWAFWNEMKIEKWKYNKKYVYWVGKCVGNQIPVVSWISKNFHIGTTFFIQCTSYCLPSTKHLRAKKIVFKKINTPLNWKFCLFVVLKVPLLSTLFSHSLFWHTVHANIPNVNLMCTFGNTSFR